MFVAGVLLDRHRDGPLFAAVEKFVTGPRAARLRETAGKTTADMASVLAALIQRRGRPCAQRPAALVKPWATDERLEAAGLLEVTKGMPHARDACRARPVRRGAGRPDARPAASEGRSPMSAPAVPGLTPEQAAAIEVARSLAEAGIPFFTAQPAQRPDGAWDPSGGSGGCGYWLPQGWSRSPAEPAAVDAWRPGMALCMVAGHGLDVIDVDPRNGGDLRALNGSLPVCYRGSGDTVGRDARVHPVAGRPEASPPDARRRYPGRGS